MTTEEKKREPRIPTKAEYLKILDEAIIRARQREGVNPNPPRYDADTRKFLS